MNTLKLLPTIYALLTFVVLVVEDAFDGVPGAQKKQEALTSLKSALAGAGITLPTFLNDAVLGTFIDIVVGLFNKVGTFRKGFGLPHVQTLPSGQQIRVLQVSDHTFYVPVPVK